jgi:hypothetical protein
LVQRIASVCEVANLIDELACCPIPGVMRVKVQNDLMEQGVAL